MYKLILILLSFCFGVLCIRHIRKYDVHEKEPLVMMMAVTAWGGLVSIGISLYLYRVLFTNGIHISTTFPLSYVYVGMVEELAKLLALFCCWPIIHREMDELTDGAIYIACVALGFSLIENYFYARSHPDISGLIAIRLLICTPMHIAFSLFMGLAFYLAVRLKRGWGLLTCAYLIASTYHALYDIFVGYWILLPGLYFVLLGAYRWMYRLLGYTAAQSPFRQSLAEFIHTFPAPPIEPGLKCIDCGNGAPKPTYERGRIRIQRCEQCGTYLCSPVSLSQIVHQYGSIFGSLRKKYKRPALRSPNIRILIGGNRIDCKRQIACFRLDEFNAILEKISGETAQNLERKWWFPFRTSG